MKSNAVAPIVRTSGQNPDALNRAPIAAVAPRTRAGITVITVASRWNNGNGQYNTSSDRSRKFSTISSACRTANRCDSRHPFDRPVVPEVNSTSAGSSSPCVPGAAVPGRSRTEYGSTVHCGKRAAAPSWSPFTTSVRAVVSSWWTGVSASSSESSTTSTRAPVRFSAWARAGPRNAVFTGAATAPARLMPNQVTTISGQFGSSRATRSPAPTPRSTNDRAAALLSASHCR
jgi:hypothetical protein